mmetsp:Transcript_98009/g.184241  ORF Transcript_98009/g.184241 Transcript_98009/m.184241 type:complete len:539 (+) Transcript_98009:130-1746(+)
MILYDNQSQFLILFQRAGSVIPQSLPIGVFTGSLGLFLAILRHTGKTKDLYDDGKYIKKAFAIQVLATVVGYLIVVRTNMALRRWMDGISDIQAMLSKWGDAYNTLIGFFSGKEGPPSMQKRILMFRVRMAHWFSLMSCLAFATLRGGSLGKLSDVPIRELLNDGENGDAISFSKYNSGGRRTSTSSHTGSVDPKLRKSRTSSFSERAANESAFTSRDSNELMGHKLEALRESELVVLHRPSNEEVERLDSCTDAVNLVCLWIIQGIILEIRAKTLDTPPPIVTRVFQELSNGMLGFSQAHKVAMVPFPFPFAQMVSCLLVFFYIVFPFYVDAFTQNIIVTPLISTLVPICYNGLNCLAIELEEPFGCDHNDVDIEVRHEEFNKMLVDTIRQPSKPPRLKANGEVAPEAKITRGVSRGMDEVYRRVDGCWPWELVTMRQKKEEETFQLRRRDMFEDIAAAPEPEALAASPRNAPSNIKESTDQASWAEESHCEEVGTENGYAHKGGLLCGNRCNPDSGMTAMRMVDGDLAVMPEEDLQ